MQYRRLRTEASHVALVHLDDSAWSCIPQWEDCEKDNESVAVRGAGQTMTSLSQLPEELLLRVLYFLDIPDLLSTSRVSRPQACESEIS